jgi:hypothetical protein
MCESDLARIYTMGLEIGPLRQPAIKTRGKAVIVSNESTDATDGEHCRRDERPSHRSGRRFTSCLSEQVFRRHLPLLSFTRRAGNSNAVIRRKA